MTRHSMAEAQDSAASAIPAPATLMPEIPNLDLWRQSPHANITREAFRHWDTEDDKMIPETCSKCHSTAGFMDYLGADGSAAGVVDVKHSPDPAVAPGIACMACHNEVSQHMTSVTFPSGVEQEVFTPDVRCMTCHGGRASTVQVNEAIEKAGVANDDTASAEIEFVNIHYRAAAATRFGGEVHGGFEYDGQEYAGYYFHDRDSQTCNDCHSPHTLKVKVNTCAECHDEVVGDDKKSLQLIRTSKADFDGNGDTSEGIYAEIQTVHDQLLLAIQGYGKDVVGTAVAYDKDAYPYFFQDSDGSGAIEEGEAKFPNRYQGFTPRMLKAAYNYQVVAKDPGAYTHNAYYVLQLMQDSIADLSTAGSGVEMSGARPK
ncbi:cytochrome c3 family protein [Tropicimonas sp. IMCC34043]|uniref:cytochrome c3 family protein n=1 Tax=Tropicimonas sp. IMCC34043 TaxID=2248760 RepID=UPI0018E5865D|nr:cytochrome c3 family protein [Tropicimonas sp. IMCC34043]